MAGGGGAAAAAAELVEVETVVLDGTSRAASGIKEEEVVDWPVPGRDDLSAPAGRGCGCGDDPRLVAVAGSGVVIEPVDLRAFLTDGRYPSWGEPEEALEAGALTDTEGPVGADIESPSKTL